MKVTESLEVLSVFGVKLATGRDDDPMAMYREIDEASRKIGQLEKWVLERRFPVAGAKGIVSVENVQPELNPSRES